MVPPVLGARNVRQHCWEDSWACHSHSAPNFDAITRARNTCPIRESTCGAHRPSVCLYKPVHRPAWNIAMQQTCQFTQFLCSEMCHGGIAVRKNYRILDKYGNVFEGKSLLGHVVHALGTPRWNHLHQQFITAHSGALCTRLNKTAQVDNEQAVYKCTFFHPSPQPFLSAFVIKN